MSDDSNRTDEAGRRVASSTASRMVRVARLLLPKMKPYMKEAVPWVGFGIVSVEVPGIEPGSFVDLTGLLRAQFTSSLLGPTDLAN